MTEKDSAIIKALKEVGHLRIANGSRWLLWDDFLKEWVVYGRKPYKKKSTIVYSGEDEVKAVYFLLYKDEGE